MDQTNILTPKNLQIYLHRWSFFGFSPNSSNMKKISNAVSCFVLESFSSGSLIYGTCK